MTTDPSAAAPTAHLSAADHPELVRAPRTTFVSIRGSGRPGTAEFYRKKELVGAVVRALPAARQVRAAAGVVEIVYWYPDAAAPVDIADFYWVNPIDDLEYRVLAQVDDGTTGQELVSAVGAADATDATDVGAELFTLPERLVVQVMHHGPFAEERETLAGLGAFAASRGVRRVGAHHEIHLDPFTARTPQDELRTILRDPVG
ncbi:GyrI-like domain-containing protein [Pseudonocardia sp. WMMC193]|uniref:GyrI-like domain-containing protein n=1 Tax=Pseudonocardia sp. WMMC193 TaxID=2911965 RepID=UPI001F2EB927|nr:GyrI-like domain-containing protein [Pseudonocardia sp. WMMC193]MCF7549466.1 GyrI-like domain-containing protein [Pseudonocardia sp. WMMC193]